MTKSKDSSIKPVDTNVVTKVDDKTDVTKEVAPELNKNIIKVQSTYPKPDAEPVLIIGGVKIDLKEVTEEALTSDYFFTSKRTKRALKGVSSFGNFSDRELQVCEDPKKWYGAEVNGIMFYLTMGTTIKIKNLYELGLFSESSSSNLTVFKAAFSNINVESLDVVSGGHIKLFNVNMNLDRVHMDNVCLSNGDFLSSGSGNLKNVKVGNFYIFGKERIDLQDVQAHDIEIRGGGWVILKNVKRTIFYNLPGLFRLDLFSSLGVDINIENVNLKDFDFVAAIQYSNNERLNNKAVYITGQVDYGFIAGNELVPFIRGSNNSIHVGGHHFTPEELLGKSQLIKQTVNEFQPFNFGGYLNGESLDPSLSEETIKKIWVVTFGGCEDTLPPKYKLDKIVVGMLQNTINQIKSKLEVFVLARILKIKGDEGEWYVRDF